MTSLQIYVTDDCWSCEESRRLAAEVRARLPWVEVELLDLNTPDRPGNVFAAPTYLLDGQVIFLGNPQWSELHGKLKTHRAGERAEKEA